MEGRASPEGNSRQAAVARTLSRIATSIRVSAARWEQEDLFLMLAGV